MNLIILTENDIISESRYLIKDSRSEHIQNILKLATGDKLEVGLLNGPIGSAEIEKINQNQIIIKTINLKLQPGLEPEIILICALPRPQTVKKVLLTSAMMGIKEIHFIRANRVEKSYYHSPLLRPDNMRPYLLEGLSQGKLTQMPSVLIHERFKPFFEDYFVNISSDETIRLLPDIESDKFLNNVLSGDNKSIVVAIGPEGGWVPFEIEFMKDIGFKPFKLSKSILRVEHALTATLAQIELISNK